MNRHTIEIYFFGTLFLLVLALSCYILLPYAATIAVAAVLAVTVYPLHRRLMRHVPIEALAAGLTLLAIIVAVVFPILIIGSLIIAEAQEVNTALRQGGTGALSIQEVIAPLKERIVRVIPEAANFNFDALLGEGITWLSHRIGGIFANTASAVLSLLVGLIALYYFIKDGARFAQAVVALSPLDDAYDREIQHKLRLAVRSVITGTLFIALIQATMVGVGFWIFGVPNPVLWGTVGLFSALIPGVGTALVIAPAVLYLFFVGSFGASIGLLIWGVLAVGLIDNFLGPKLLGRGTAIHPLFILLSVLGGLSVFGATGFLLGPLVLSLLLVLAHIYTMLIGKGATPILREE